MKPPFFRNQPHAMPGEGYDVSRRNFLQLAGGLTGAGIVLASCHKDNNTSTGTGVKLGSGDIGILNYAYALEQLEAAYYTQLVASSNFANAFPDATERALLTDIRDHEIAHRELFKAALGSAAIISLTPNFSSVDFNNKDGVQARASILAAAQLFEDTGVTAYNGAAQFISNSDHLMLAGKIVSVEARHAAYIRDLANANSYAGTAEGLNITFNVRGLDPATLPSAILVSVQPFIANAIDGSQLP